MGKDPISHINALIPSQPVDPTPSPFSSKGNQFSSLLQTSSETPQEAIPLSPMQLSHAATAGPPNPQHFLSQLQMAQNSMLNIREHVQTPNLALKPSQANLVKKKLSNANEYLESAYKKLGGTLDQGEEKEDQQKGSGPIAQFLNHLTSGLRLIDSAAMQAKHVSALRKQLSPGDYLLIQLKLAKAQQELEFTSTLLSKSIDGFKQIMSVQL